MQIPAARIYNLPTARMYSLVSPLDSPSGGGRTVPRTVSRTALQEALTETRTVTRTALREALSNSPSGKKDRTYDLYTGLHTYGVSYPAGLRRPELVPTETQTAFRLYETISCEGEKKPDHCMALCMREFLILESPLHLYI